jgi:deazaflavin-dependent oxidoreductase (nitroreductase family)
MDASAGTPYSASSEVIVEFRSTSAWQYTLGVDGAMSSTEEVTDSPVGWVAKHIREYVESNGRKGHRWYKTNTLLLTTRGRKTGMLRRTALIYGADEGRYVVVASNGGKPNNPLWLLNLRDDPQVQVQVGGQIFTARAQEATGQERARLWQMMAAIFPEYDRMRPRAAKAGREIPVVVLERLR